jgi:2-phosphosulfolactate phosphatase
MYCEPPLQWRQSWHLEVKPQVFSDLDQLIQVSEKWPAERRLRAGERAEKCQVSIWATLPLTVRQNGCKDAGCSSAPLMAPVLYSGCKMPLCTSSCLRQPLVSSEIYPKPTARDSLVVGSGWKAVFARGYSVCWCDRPQPFKQANLPTEELAGNDEVIAAIALYSQWQDKLLELFHQS